jgi:intracellular sulfur oxidation DsrE/DsrF family protein
MNRDTGGVERLHAFVDGQLSTADKTRLLEDMERDAELRRQVCELQRLKDYVSVAFETLPPQPSSKPKQNLWLRGVAALLLLVTGFFAGYWTAPATAPGTEATRHIVLHVNTADSEKFLAALANAEALAAKATRAEVEVVANANGLNLLRRDKSPVATQVRQAMLRHPNIRFVACNISIDNQRWLGEEPELIEGIQVAPSAAEHILHRMEQGWSYIGV